ncbi:MAG: TonB-dependent receptor, partial [Myxococcales bacterium]|nr:TonB-dependent receptor [Myxococcales bacterium]
ISEFDSSCPDQLFDANGLTDRFQVEENTLPIGDSYRAGLDVYAGYVMLDAHLIENLRLIAGPRLEVSKQTVETFDPYGTNSEAVAGEIEGLDVLPALSLVWGLRDDMNLRFAASRTLARPQLREIAPFSFTNYFGGYVEIGNPDLDNTQIYNGDLRWEWFPSPSEVIAASLFTKHFVKPIEPILVASSGNGVITYQNVRGANLIGGEVEARKNFGFITEPLDDLSIIGNVTLAFSKVDIDPSTPGAVNLRSLERPLTNQAPWVVNLSLDYDNQDIGFQVRALYNIIGRRIAFPSENPVPDVYFQPRHELGATVGQMLAPGLQAKLTGSNLLNDDFRLTYTKKDTEQNLHRQWRTGAQLSVSLSYTY